MGFAVPVNTPFTAAQIEELFLWIVPLAIYLSCRVIYGLRFGVLVFDGFIKHMGCNLVSIHSLSSLHDGLYKATKH